MARIFRALLIAAVNAIQEFFAFATDNGESQVGDSIKLNDGMATSNYDWSAYPSDTTVTGIYTATGTVEQIKEVGGNTVYVTQEPEQDNKDVKIKAGQMYYAYTNENDSDDSVYTTDDPISKGAFILENATNNGCTIDSDMAYGSSNNKIIVNNISNLNTYNSWSFNTKFVYNGGGGGTYGQQVLGVGSGHGIRLGTLSNNRLFCCLSSADGSWTIAGDGTYLNKTLTVGNTYYLQFGYDSTQYYCKCEETPITQETNTIWTLTSPLKVNTSGGLWLLNYHYSPSAEWFAGPIYLDETNFVLDGVVTTFGYFTNPSILYDDTFTALNPQPEFTVGINSITVTSETPNITYNRNSDNDEIKQITSNIEVIDNTTIQTATIISDQNATIETSADVTSTNNNVVITDGSRHSFNITIPPNKVAYIESAGISYQFLDMPIDVYNGRGVGIALKDSANSQTSYYINSWIVNKNYDLHYQQITFTTNVQNPIIIFKINNIVIESPYYGYCGDNYTYTISKKGYEDYNGSGKISYSSKDGNIINIEANLTPSSNSIDVTGWTYSVDNGVVTLLDGPVDASGELTFPNIEEE